MLLFMTMVHGGIPADPGILNAGELVVMVDMLLTHPASTRDLE